jgi:YidC/Oxa1 family membrane protein insertase
MLGTLFNEILYRPIFNGLVFLYNIIPGHDFGVSIILLTVLIRIILFPLAYYSIKSRQSLAIIQPKLKEIQQKYKTKEEQSRELMKAYKEHGVNPFSGCLPILIQLPILLALYQVLIKVLKPESLSTLYSFIKNPIEINPLFLGTLDLSVPNYILAVLAGVSQFFYSKLTMKYSPQLPQAGDKKGAGAGIQKVMGRQMMYFMPILTIFIALRLPAGLALYWFLSTILGLAQDYFLIRRRNWSYPNAKSVV